MMVHGIDYSMSSPAMVSWNPDQPFNWNNVKVSYITDGNKFVRDEPNMLGVKHKEYTSQEERFHYISSFFSLSINPDDIVALEGYAFGAKGQVFNIGENTGMLKHKLWKMGAEYHIVGPTVLKKHATGKGNADKAAMNDAFVKREGYDLKTALGATEKQWNPSSDIIDAFFLCDWAGHHILPMKRSNGV